MSTPEDDFDGNPYDLLAEDHDEGHRWAFGTGFTDPLEGIDTSVPDGLDPGALVRFCLALGDDALIYSHRLQQWVARLPELEEETAVANIALDLLGQARMLLARAGAIVGQTEDQLAFFREEKEFRNVRLAEHADRDFAELVVRLLMFSTWRLALFELADSNRSGLSPAPATRCSPRSPPRASTSSPTTATTRRAGWSGSATAPPCRTPRRRRPSTPCGRWWASCSGPTPTRSPIVDRRRHVRRRTRHRPGRGGPDRPDAPPLAAVGGRAGRDGVHTEAMGYILAELQSVARAHPDATW